MPIPRRLHVARSLCFFYRRFASEATEQRGGQSDHTARTSNLTQIELSITEVTSALAPNSSILNKPLPPPLILARQPVSRQPLLTTAAMYAAPTPAVVTDQLTSSK
jgi:hypothetical protein